MNPYYQDELVTLYHGDRMTAPTYDPASIERRAWLRGWCPCCQDTLGTLDDAEHPPTVIAEGVLMCAGCVERGHDDDDTVAVILEALLPRRQR